MAQSPFIPQQTGDVAGLLAVARAALCEAYAAIRNDMEDVASPGEVLAQVAQAQQVVDAAHAVQTMRLAQHAGTVTHHDPAGIEDTAGRGLAARASWADARRFADVAGELQWGPRTAATRCRDAVVAMVEFPHLLDALAEGAIDRERVTAVIDACRDLPEDQLRSAAPVVEQAMLEGTRGGIECWTATSTRKRARAAVAAVDAWAPVRHRARAIREAVGISFQPGRVQGTSVLTATLTTEQAVVVRAGIEDLARRYQTSPTDAPGCAEERNQQVAEEFADPVFSLNQFRAQALVDLIGANAQVEASATLLVPVSTPSQALVGRAVEGLGQLLAAQGLQLALAPVSEHQPGWVTSPEDRLATPTELAAFGTGEPPPATSGQALSTEQPLSTWPPPTVAPPGVVAEQEAAPPGVGPGSVDPPWIPPARQRLAGDARTVHATAMNHLGDRLNALHDRSNDTCADTVGGGVPTGLEEADRRTWQPGRPGDVTVDGVGVIHAETVAGLIAALGADIGRALVDPATGTVREHRTNAYRPTAGMRRLIHARDQTCRFPGCTRPAKYTDADHVTPHQQGGPTTPANLISLCRTHHRAKGSGAWQVALHDDDTVTWTSLTGRHLTTWPATDPAPF